MPYVDIESGILHLDAEITYGNTVEFLATFRQMEISAKIQGITVHVTSHGGALMPTVAIVQTLKTSLKPVSTVGAGYVASGALPVLAAGTKGQRSVLEGTKLLLHEPTHTLGETSRKSPNIDGWKNEIAFLEEITEQYFWILEKCSYQKASFWKNFLGKHSTHVVQVDDAVKYGLIDHIIPLEQN